MNHSLALSRHPLSSVIYPSTVVIGMSGGKLCSATPIRLTQTPWCFDNCARPFIKYVRARPFIKYVRNNTIFRNGVGKHQERYRNIAWVDNHIKVFEEWSISSPHALLHNLLTFALILDRSASFVREICSRCWFSLFWFIIIAIFIIIIIIIIIIIFVVIIIVTIILQNWHEFRNLYLPFFRLLF